MAELLSAYGSQEWSIFMMTISLILSVHERLDRKIDNIFPFQDGPALEGRRSAPILEE
jgi:hypothetical protein